MSIKRDSAGFTIIEIVLLMVALSALIGVGVVGYAAVKKADKQSSKKDAAKTTQEARSKEFFEFSDLDMKFEKTSSNKDMFFKASKDASAMHNAYDKKLNSLAQKCYGGENREVAFSSIGRDEGYGGTGDKGIVAKQFDTFNIIIQKPEGVQPCTDVNYQNEFSQKLTNLQNQLEYSIKGAEKL